MHELAIAQSIINTLTSEMQSRNLDRIEAVGIRVGQLSGVQVEALRFGFEAAVRDTGLEGVVLHVDEVSSQGKCLDCGLRFEVEALCFLCVRCASTRLEVTHGQELDISFIDICEDS